MLATGVIGYTVEWFALGREYIYPPVFFPRTDVYVFKYVRVPCRSFKAYQRST